MCEKIQWNCDMKSNPLVNHCLRNWLIGLTKTNAHLALNTKIGLSSINISLEDVYKNKEREEKNSNTILSWKLITTNLVSLFFEIIYFLRMMRLVLGSTHFIYRFIICICFVYIIFFFIDSIELVASFASFHYFIRWKIMFYDHKSWHQFRFNNRVEQENIVVKRYVWVVESNETHYKIVVINKMFITSLLILFSFFLCNAKRYANSSLTISMLYLKST